MTFKVLKALIYDGKVYDIGSKVEIVETNVINYVKSAGLVEEIKEIEQKAEKVTEEKEIEKAPKKTVKK